MTTATLSTCIACGQKARMRDHRSSICPACVAQIEADMSAPLPVLTETPRGFRKLLTGMDL